MATSQQPRKRSRHRRTRIFVLLALIVAGLYAMIGLFPAPTIEFVGKQWLGMRGVTPAQFTVTRADLSTMVIEDIRLGPGPDLTVDRLRFEYSLSDLVQRRVRRIVIDRARLVGQVGPVESLADIGASFSLGVLDHLWPGPRAAERQIKFDGLPEIQLNDGVFRLQTPIGTIDSEVNLRTAPTGEVELHIALTETTLLSDDVVFELSSLHGHFRRTPDGRLETDFDLQIPRLALGDYSLAAAQFAYDYAGDELTGGGTISGQIRALRLSGRDVGDLYAALPSGLRLALEADPLADYSAAFGDLLRRALLQTEIDLRARIRRDGDGFHFYGATSDAMFALVGGGAGNADNVDALPVMTLTLDSLVEDRPLFSLKQDAGWHVSLAGLLTLNGNDLPEASVGFRGQIDLAGPTIGTLIPSVSYMDFSEISLNMSPWTVGGRTIKAEDIIFSFKSNRQTSLGGIAGSVYLDGPVFGDLALSHGQLTLDGRYRYEDRQFSYHQRGSGCAVLDSEGIQLAGVKLRRSQVNFCATEQEPLVRVLIGKGFSSELQIRVHVAPGYSTLETDMGPDLRGLFPELELYGEYLPEEGDWRLTFSLLNGAIILPGETGTIMGLRLTGLASGRTGDSLEVEMGLDGLTLHDTRAPARYAPISITGSGRISNDGVHLDGQAATQGGIHIASLKGDYDLVDGSGWATAVMGDLVLEPGSLQPQDLFPVLSGVVTNVTGRVTASAELKWQDGTLQSSGRVTLEDLGFVSQVGRVSGIDTNIELASLFPLTTEKPQTIDIDQINTWIPLVFGSLEVSFDVDDGLVIESARWPWFGGEIGLDRSVLDFESGVYDFVLTAKDIDLAEAISLVNLADLSGSGLIEGIVPVTVAQGRVSIKNGRLVSVGDGGTIRYTGNLVDVISQDEGSKMLFEALNDFKYDKLEILLDGTSERMSVKVGLEGCSVAVLNCFPIKTSINIPDAPVDTMIRSGIIPIRVEEELRRRVIEGQ